MSTTDTPIVFPRITIIAAIFFLFAIPGVALGGYELDISIGDYANLLGAALLMDVSYDYIHMKQETEREKKKTHRKAATITFLFFLIFSYSVALFIPSSSIWTAQVGFSVEEYFQTFATNFSLVGEESSEPKSVLDLVASGLRTIGLAIYVLIFSVLSISAKAPLNIAQRLVART